MTIGIRIALTAGLLTATFAPAPAQAACPELARLRADPRWRALDSDNCEMCVFVYARIGPGAALRWNGQPISEVTLRRYLRLMRGMNPRPVTLLSVGEPADCAAIARIAALIAGRERCGPNHYCHYGFGGWHWH